MYKKIWINLLTPLICMTCMIHLPQVNAAGKISINVNGAAIRTDAAAYVEQGRTLVPVHIAEQLKGVHIDWNPAAKTVEIDADNERYLLKVGGKFAAAVNGKQKISLPVPAVIKQNRVMVPIQFIVELSGAWVTWNSKTHSVSIQEEIDSSKLKAAAVSQGGEAKLYAVQHNEGMYRGFYLNILGKEHYYVWGSMDEQNLPQLLYTDLTGDGKPEAVVILTIGTGTGVHLQDIHVINPLSFEDIPVEDPIDTIHDKVKSTVKKNKTSDEADVSITVNGETTHTTAQYYNTLFDHVSSGGVVYYNMNQAAITVSVGASISIANYIGKFLIAYTYEQHSNRFVGNDIGYEPYE